MKTFMRERANISFRASLQLQKSFDSLIQSAREEGGLDSAVRQKLAEVFVDVQALQLNCERFGEQLYGFHSSMIKVAWAEANQQLQELGLDRLGAKAALMPEQEGSWQFGYLRSRGNSIEGGTAEILRGVIAERVLGLPRK